MSNYQKNKNYPMVYLYDYGILGLLLKYNAHASLVKYELDGIDYESLMLNEDFEIVEELGIGLDDYDY